MGNRMSMLKYYGCFIVVILLGGVALVGVALGTIPFSEPVIAWLRSFIVYSPAVPAVRKALIVSGSAMIVIAGIYWMLARSCGRRTLELMSDHSALGFFLAALFVVPFSCFELSAMTGCYFFQFQGAASFVLFAAGSVVAVRTRRYRYIAFYLVLFLLLGGLVPPT